jgi:putative component of membrane protein insertase Oxa1/YidC/SpoIIIJ protein YidD
MAKGRRVKYVLIGFVRLWRRIISPLYGDVCKYHPTCSAYGLRALEVHGVDYVPGTPEAEQWLAQGAATTSPMGPVGSAASGVKE